MKIKIALAYFRKKVSQTSSKSDIKVYQQFIRILTKLDARDLSTEDRMAIETELKRLDLDAPVPRNKSYYKKALTQFEKYLLNTFSYTSKGYYAKSGMALGMTFGLLFGIVILSNLERSMGIALGLSLGMFIGLLVGRNLDEKAISAGKVI